MARILYLLFLSGKFSLCVELIIFIATDINKDNGASGYEADTYSSVGWYHCLNDISRNSTFWANARPFARSRLYTNILHVFHRHFTTDIYLYVIYYFYNHFKIMYYRTYLRIDQFKGRFKIMPKQSYPVNLKTLKSTGSSCQIHFSI